MTHSNYVLITILICALCTQITRWLPFLLFGGKKEVPGLVRYLGTSLPAAIILCSPPSWRKLEHTVPAPKLTSLPMMESPA